MLNLSWGRIRVAKLIFKAWVVSGLLWSGQAIASIPYVDHHYSVKQPDGSELKLVLNGTSYYAEQRTQDGYLVVYDKNKRGFCYAQLSQDGERLVSSGVLAIAKNAHHKARFDKSLKLPKHARRAIGRANHDQLMSVDSSSASTLSMKSLQVMSAPVTGNVRGLTILIQFPDAGATIGQWEVENFVNQIGYNGYGNAQSIRDYFSAVSGGQLDYTNTVSRYYIARYNKSYYTDPSIPYGTRAKELIREALSWLENSEGFDFSTLSTDSSGNIRGLNVFYTGESGSWGQGLWPHQGVLGQAFCADGVCATQYQITNMSNQLTIGTFIHESGHLVFGWPDLYDYDGSSNGSVATFGIMGYGSLGSERPHKPVPPNGYFRHLAGWEAITELNPAVNPNAPSGQLFHQANSNTLYRWSNPNKQGEAFYIEARIQQGQNEYLPDAGLAIWHVDNDGSNNNEWHPYVQMEHADGNRDPENSRNSGDSTDLYVIGEQERFDDTFPNAGTNRSTNSRWWDGSDSSLKISNIGAMAANMSFTVGDGSANNVTELAAYQSQNVPTTAAGNSRMYKMELPSAAGQVKFTLQGGSGDADLYVKYGSPASTNDYDCRSTDPGSTESCPLTGKAGTWYATVYAYNGISDVSIEGQYYDRYTGSLTGPGDSNIEPNGSWFYYNGGEIVGRLTGPTDADFELELQKWINGSWQKVDASTLPTTQESIDYNAGAGYYQFRIYSYSGSGSYEFTLKK